MPCVAETAFNLDTSVSAGCEIHLWYRAPNLLRADFVAKQLLYPLEKKNKHPGFGFGGPKDQAAWVLQRSWLGNREGPGRVDWALSERSSCKNLPWCCFTL